ncbi:hypothetical protein B586_16355 [Mycobacterium haemophilum DSM 44634]|nr:PPE domain-containing protein [Mycobacterium haemophilum]AKN17794.2 hypothetical protein B586_16355 [Mycobacterium haemophilum DSM 44634]
MLLLFTAIGWRSIWEAWGREFFVLPPEINSLRMFAGAGTAPMLAAAAWEGLAEELGSAAQSFVSVTTGLAGQARVVASIFEAAQAATVIPAAIAGNRNAFVQRQPGRWQRW